MNHVEIDPQFVRDRVAMGEAPAPYLIMLIFAKGLAAPLFLDVWDSLSNRKTPVFDSGRVLEWMIKLYIFCGDQIVFVYDTTVYAVPCKNCPFLVCLEKKDTCNIHIYEL